MSNPSPSRRLVSCAAALLAPALMVASAAAQEAAPLDKATQDTTLCTPINAGVFGSRVHVRCSVAVNGILYFSVSTADANAAARVLAAFSTAVAAGRDLRIYFDPADTSGTAFGCQAADCRKATGVELL